MRALSPFEFELAMERASYWAGMVYVEPQDEEEPEDPRHERDVELTEIFRER